MSEQNAGNGELKPCPFCGSKNIDPEGWASQDSRGPACDDCGASSGSVHATYAKNIAAWNTRAPSVGAGEYVERIASILMGRVNAPESVIYDTARQIATAPGREEGLELGVGLVPLPANSLERYSMMFARDHGPFTNTALADMHIDLARALYGEAETEFPLSPSSAHPGTAIPEGSLEEFIAVLSPFADAAGHADDVAAQAKKLGMGQVSDDAYPFHHVTFGALRRARSLRNRLIDEQSYADLRASGGIFPEVSAHPAQGLVKALEWYAEQVEGCRKITSEGNAARAALDADGGKRARAALSAQGKDNGWFRIDDPENPAPKDGTVIDLWGDNQRWECCFWGKPAHDCGEAGNYCDSEWHSLNDGWVYSTFDEPLTVGPTHWRPLPAPPSTPSREG